MWSFILERPAKRSNIRTGAVVGETMIMEDISVDGTTYGQKVIRKDGVFQAMREKTWWHQRNARFKVEDGKRVPCWSRVRDTWKFDAKRGRKCPEAGKPLYYQHYRAQPHTVQLNKRVFAAHSKMKQFEIEVVLQPAQSPDLNVDGLATACRLTSNWCPKRRGVHKNPSNSQVKPSKSGGKEDG